MQVKRHPALAVLFVIAIPLAILAFVAVRFGTYTHELQATIEVSKADIGIPGVTKMYEVRLSNTGRLPVRVTACDFVDDAFSPGTMVAYAVQRWDRSSKSWVKVMEFGPDSFCKPYPLGIVKASMVKRWIWPGGSLSAGEEATAARGFRRGDTARFIIFTGPPGDYNHSVATPAFTIDEERSEHGPPLRIGH
jgi:hypothetical protein